MLFLDGVYVGAGEGLRFRRVPPPTPAALETLVCVISERVGRALERKGRLVRDLENTYLTLDSHDESGFDALLGHSITYRIALGPQQGRNAFTLQTLPADGVRIQQQRRSIPRERAVILSCMFVRA